MLLGVRSLMLPTLIREKRRVMGWASNVFTSVCVALLCWFDLRLLVCVLVQHNSKWRHVSFWWDVQRLHVGNMIV